MALIDGTALRGCPQSSGAADVKQTASMLLLGYGYVADNCLILIMAEMDEFELDIAGFSGPRMLALANDRRRKFALLVGHGRHPVQAAREAGYADPANGRGDGSAYIRVQSHRLMHDSEVLEAIEEVARKAMRGLGPLAVRAGKAILENPGHPYHARMIETILDRTGFSAKTEHQVTVEHKVDTKELEDLARRLALENGIAPERLIGFKTIEGEISHETDAGG